MARHGPLDTHAASSPGAGAGAKVPALPARGSPPQGPQGPLGRAAGVARRLARLLLAVPLFYKILLANAAIVVAGAAAGTALTAHYVRTAPHPQLSLLELVGAFVAVGVLASVLVNAIILRLALKPLRALEVAAARVHGGDLAARAAPSPLADRELARLTVTFNAMLDRLEIYRRRVRASAARVLHVAEEERKRIAKDLHDDTAQTLAALLVRIRLLQSIHDSAQRDAALGELRREIADAMERIRLSARGLRPPDLDAFGLAVALESLVRSIADATGIQAEFSASPLEGVLPPDAELALYRIVQEALSNVVRHSHATRVRLNLRAAADRVIVTVEDDGRGFDADRVLANGTRGFGLFGIRERAEYLDGTAEIQSAPGKGTRIEVTIPRPATGHAPYA